MKTITLIGATGLVGKEIAKQAKDLNLNVNIFSREQRELILNQQHNHIIFCAGENKCNLESLTNIVDVNSLFISQLIQKQNFVHLTYFSSTRIYNDSVNTSEEAVISFDFKDPRALFNASKLLGETACSFSQKPVLIIRPSNIYGVTTTSQLFLPAITRNAVRDQVVNMHVNKDYAKDYINVKDVAFFALEMSQMKLSGIYNVASGKNIPAERIAQILEAETQCKTVWHSNNNKEIFHPIKIEKLKTVFPHYVNSVFEDDLKFLANEFKEIL